MREFLVYDLSLRSFGTLAVTKVFFDVTRPPVPIVRRLVVTGLPL